MTGFTGTSITITINYNSSQSMMTVSFWLPSWTTSVFSSAWLGSDLLVSQFFSFRCPLVNTAQLNTRLLTTEPLNPLELNWTELNSRMTAPLRISLSLMLRPTVNRPVCLGIKHPSVSYDQIFISVWNTSDSYVLDSVGRPLWREAGLSFVCAAGPC
jgi:hypothetical protein